MAWNYPEVSLQDMVKLIKGFVDILILASGYQSSGLPAHWDVHNIRKAFQWGTFFEKVLSNIISSDLYRDSVRDLDAALMELKSDPLFPQSLANLSLETLSRARDFVSAHLINHLTLRDTHLQAFVMAKAEGNDNDMNFTVQELFKRLYAVSCISTLETGLDVLQNSVSSNRLGRFDSITLEQMPKCREGSQVSIRKEKFVKPSMWDHWSSRALAYFLNKRTVRLVSGASLIFSAPKIQWVKVLGQLDFSSECGDAVFSEKIELLLLGCVASRWSQLLEYFMSVSYEYISISEQHDQLCNLLRQTSYKEGTQDLKAGEILEYLTEILSPEVHHLQKVPPVLVAAAIPPWSPLFQLYFQEIERQCEVDSPEMRYCSCNQDVEKKHNDCQ